MYSIFVYFALTLLVLVLAFLAYCVCTIQYYRMFFKRQGIATPPIPSYLYGHLKLLWGTERYSENLREWTQQYGSIYGFVAGTRPVYIVSDVSFLQEVFVNQFSKFYGRHVPLLTHILGRDRLHVFASSGDQWHRHRQIIVPAFSSLKLKSFFYKIRQCTKTFVDLSNEGDIDILIRLKQFTFDVICQCGFNLETNVQKNSSNIWLQKLRQIFDQDFDRSSLAMLNRFLPALGKLWGLSYRLLRAIGICNTPANLWIIENSKTLIDDRISSYENKQSSTNSINMKQRDVLQTLLDATYSKQPQLSPKELFSNVFVILVAGFDTPSTILSYCLHTLAYRHDLQEQLRSEITNNSYDSESIKPDLPEFIYLDAFIKEVLRMTPSTIQFVHRRCIEDTLVKGYKIPKGSLIQTDVFTIHYNDELWGPLPVNEFHLERHFTKRHPFALLSFGAGPRQCLGRRFALMELKLFLIEIINAFYIEQVNEKSPFIKTKEALTIAPEEVWIKLVRRIP